jgi:hypothetical protein
MIMGFKYQLVSCNFPQQILQITLYHLEILKAAVKSDTISKAVQSAISSTVNLYTSLTNGQWMLLNQSLMRFLQGKKTKVSLFLQRSLQTVEGVIVLNNDGSLPYGTEKPGTITSYEGGQVIRKRKVHMAGYENCVESEQMFDLSSTIGFNMYLPDSAGENAPSFASLVSAGRDMGAQIAAAAGASPSSAAARKVPSTYTGRDRGGSAPIEMKSTAKAELNLLADLLGMGASSKDTESDAKPFKINLFPDNSFDDKGGGGGAKGERANFISIDIDGTSGAKTFESYMQDLKLRDDDEKRSSKADGKLEEEDDDLLALMDSTASSKK